MDFKWNSTGIPLEVQFDYRKIARFCAMPHGWAKAELTSEGEMKAVFTVGGDGEFPAPNYDIAVMFNGVPGTVILEVEETSYSGGSNEPTTTHKRCIMRSPLKASQARALASAILSAATETNAAT